ncbi:gamma-tubulin complex component 6 isoform X2 [Talpa occidentalis]|uniref:gamma-tubulin complex component 6 isoform X2 n=1 Tax=Talpa occidentalis TaxID=50954 RepID=UPI00188E0214|nr:gamma-tubulin complex component 6 isoform X2 [Talpa occidentalis]
MASITQLFDDLCEAFLPAAEARLGQRDGSRRRAKRSLRRAAYGALFPRRPRDATAAARPAPPRRALRSEVLMLSFDLRVGGRGPEADRLEALVELLAAAPGRAPAELEPVLDLLVRLAGSGPPPARPPGRGYAFHSRLVGRRVPYGGYDCAGLSGCERDVRSLLSREEGLCRDAIQKTLQVMEAAPGTGLPAVGRFLAGDPCGDRFERDTRLSLFGALVHSRAWDMDVRLDLPPVPAGAALSGLAIKVPRSVDQSEDEGFQSASNLTPDSQSELGLTPDVDLWDAVLTYRASKRRCWEQVGCPPGHREEPYLTEAGRDAFDRFCRLRQGELQVLGGGLLQTPQPALLKECELVKDALNVLIGVVSTTFSLCQLTQVFVVKQGVHVSGASPESTSSLLSELAEHGTYYARLSHFSVQPALDTACSRGLVFQAFTSGLRRYLQYYRACVLATQPTLSLLALSFLFKRLGRQLRYLAELCGVGAVPPGAGGEEPRAAFPSGVKLLSYLYQEALDNCSNEHYPVLLSLLKTSCEPYTRFIHDWVYSGVFRDLYGEFMIQVNHEYLGFRDKSYWTRGYVLLAEAAADGVPAFLRHVAQDVYVCGKTVNLLRLCCPRHYLCWSDVPVPPISVTFSLEELRRVEQECAIYVGRVERAARLSCVSKEEKELRMEMAKQELIIHARAAASRALQALSDQQASERSALDARKREQFRELQEQFVKDQERRRAARQEPENNLGRAGELWGGQERPWALEEWRERTARQALASHCGELSAEAARREQVALWRVQRLRLAGARRRFLLDDEEHVQGLLRARPEGRPLEQPALSPSADSQVGSEQPALPSADSQGLPVGAGSPAAGHSPDTAWDCSDLPPAPAPVTAGTCAQGLGTGLKLDQPEGQAPFPETLSIQDFLPAGGGAEPPLHADGTPMLEAALQTIGSDLPPATPPALQPSEPQEYDFGTVLRPAEAATTPSLGPLQTAGGSEGGQPGGPSLVELDTGVPSGHRCPLRNDPCLEGKSQTARLLPGPVSDSSASSRPRWQVRGHVSEASVRVGENVWDVASSRPRWNVHGHVSQSHVVLGALSGEAQPHGPLHKPFTRRSPRDRVCPEAQSPAQEADPEPAVGLASGGTGSQEAGPGPGEECIPQGLSQAAATPGVLGGTPGEPGPGTRDTEAPSPSQAPGTQQVTVAQRSPGLEQQQQEEQQQEAAWRREQAYLAGLAGQYCLEQYPDSFASMSEPPLARLLHHGLPRAFALPEDPGHQGDPEETAAQLSELLPLPVLMKHSLMTPLAAHVSLVNKAAVDHFFVDLRLEAHLEALRHFLLMEDGEFAQSLSDLLFEKLGAGQTPGELLTPLALNGLLSKALQYSLHGHGPLAARLSFALKFLPEAFTPNAPDVLSCLELRYKVDWPLNIVITEGCLSRYSGICSFLLQLKLMMWTLKDICFHLKRTVPPAAAVQARDAALRQSHPGLHRQPDPARHLVRVPGPAGPGGRPGGGAARPRRVPAPGRVQGPADGEGGARHERHPQHLQPRAQVPQPAHLPALGPRPRPPWRRAPQLRPHAAVLQHLQVLLPLPLQSGDQAGEPRLPAPPGGLPAAHQLQQLLPGGLTTAGGRGQ